MTTTFHIIQEIKEKINNSPRNYYVAELHLQCIKFSKELKSISGKEFCALLEIGESFGTEFLKMRKISERLEKAGLNPDLI